MRQHIRPVALSTVDPALAPGMGNLVPGSSVFPWNIAHLDCFRIRNVLLNVWVYRKPERA